MTQDIINEFRHARLLIGQTSLFPLDVATEIVRRCRESSIAVIGFEGFAYQPKKGVIVPRLDLILHVDFHHLHSWEEIVRYCAESAETTLAGSRRCKNLYFLFMLWCEEKWKAQS